MRTLTLNQLHKVSESARNIEWRSEPTIVVASHVVRVSKPNVRTGSLLHLTNGERLHVEEDMGFVADLLEASLEGDDAS